MLRSFSYGSFCGVNELPDEILGLFSDLVENPEKKVEFASEIISNGLQGRIDFNREFCLDAYETTIRKNQSLGKESEKKKKVFIDYNGSSDDWDEVSIKGGIKADQINSRAVDKIQDAYEDLLTDEELKYAVETIKSLNEDLIVEESIDLIYALKQAVRGIPDAVASIQRVCENNGLISELVQTILGSGYEVSQIFA